MRKQDYQLYNQLSRMAKEVLMANMSQSMEYATVYPQKDLFRRRFELT